MYLTSSDLIFDAITDICLFRVFVTARVYSGTTDKVQSTKQIRTMRSKLANPCARFSFAETSSILATTTTERKRNEPSSRAARYSPAEFYLLSYLLRLWKGIAPFPLPMPIYPLKILPFPTSLKPISFCVKQNYMIKVSCMYKIDFHDLETVPSSYLKPCSLPTITRHFSQI
jgi:hypothetical protein